MGELRDYFHNLFEDIKSLQEANKQILSALDDPCAWHEYLKATESLFAPANETTMGDTLATPAKARIAAALTNHLRLIHAVAVALKQRRPAEQNDTGKPKAERRALFRGLMTILKNLLVKVLPQMVFPSEYGDLQSFCKKYRPGTMNDDFIFALGCTAEKMFDWYKRLDAESSAEFARTRQVEVGPQYARRLIIAPMKPIIHTEPVVLDAGYLTRKGKRITSDDLTENEDTVLRILVSNNAPIKKDALAKLAKVHPSTIVRICGRLRDRGSVGVRRDGGYFSTKNSPPE